MFNVDVKTFLDTLTGNRTDEAWLAAVPSIADSPPGYWFGMRYAEFAKHDRSNANCYFSLGLISEGQRTLDRWVAGTMIALDDVGEKSGEAQAVRDALGDPTAVVQTSKGSAQWFYALSAPVTDLTIMSRLQRALTLKFYPKQRDPGHERAIQYLRVPLGHNDKPARLAENDGRPQRVELAEWNPTVKLDPLDVMMALEGAWELTEHMSLTASGLSGPATEEAARAYLGNDGILAGLDLAGLVDWGRVTNGYIGTRCCWESEHTGVNDDRAGYNPDSRHFMCFHGSHGPKSTADIDEWLRANVGQPYIDMRVDMARKAFASKPLPFEPEETPEPFADEPRGRGLVSILKHAPTTPMPARRSICSHLARGEITYRIGAPAIGKSALALAYALAIAYERPDIIGEDKLTRLGDVIIVSNEDSADDYRKRLVGLLRKHNLLGVEPKHDILVTPTQNFTVAEKADRYSPVVLGEDMEWLAQRLDGVCLILIDTQSATVRLEENSNADLGAAFALLATYAKTHGVAVEMLHHTTKANGRTEGAGELTAARGAGAAGASVRNQVNMTALSAEEQRKLPLGEGPTWIRETGAKGNHSGNMGLKWWQREIVDVIVVDPDSEEPQTQAVPVYVYAQRGPKIVFDAEDPNVLLQVIDAAAEAERADEPFRVKKNRGDMIDLADALGERQEWERDDARSAIDAACKHGLLEMAQWRNPKTRKDVSVWSVTSAGLARLAEGEKVLEQ